APNEVGRRPVDRHITRLRRPRAFDLGFVIAGHERTAFANPHPVEAVIEEAGREALVEAGRLGADPAPIAADRQSGRIVAIGDHRTAEAKGGQRARRLVRAEDPRHFDRDPGSCGITTDRRRRRRRGSRRGGRRYNRWAVSRDFWWGG